MFKKISIIIVSILILILTSGCIRIEKELIQKGIYKSINKGDSWDQRVSLLSLPGQERFIDKVNVSVLKSDPQDSGTIYLGTVNSGLFVSFNGTDSWQQVMRLPKGEVKDLVIHPKAKHIVYVAIKNKIFKTEDANRTWENIYLESADKVEITSLAINSFAHDIIFASLSDGRLIRSDNSGKSWKNIKNFGRKIRQILINPYNPQIIYLVIEGDGIYRSLNQGKEWVSLRENYHNISGAEVVGKIIFDTNLPDAFFTISNAGILKTENGGKNWIQYELLSSKTSSKIYSLAVDPNNSNVIYYTTARTLYRSFDGGQNWTTKSLPNKMIPDKLLIDPINPNILYLGIVENKN